jgi:hypothetical protein
MRTDKVDEPNMELMKTPYQARRRTLSVVSPHCKPPTRSVVIDFSLAPIQFGPIAPGHSPFPGEFTIQCTGDSVPVYAAAFPSYVLLKKSINMRGMFSYPGTIECTRLFLSKELVHSFDGGIKIHCFNFWQTDDYKRSV